MLAEAKMLQGALGWLCKQTQKQKDKSAFLVDMQLGEVAKVSSALMDGTVSLGLDRFSKVCLPGSGLRCNDLWIKLLFNSACRIGPIIACRTTCMRIIETCYMSRIGDMPTSSDKEFMWPPSNLSLEGPERRGTVSCWCFTVQYMSQLIAQLMSHRWGRQII